MRREEFWNRPDLSMPNVSSGRRASRWPEVDGTGRFCHLLGAMKAMDSAPWKP